ncbi:MAG TPA: hypothetical protein VIV57_01140 [Anaeromyxobacter sp.]
MAERPSGLPYAALGFAAAAALSSWNPLSAPVALVVGLAALVLAVRALLRGGARALSAGALALSIGAVLASVLVLALTAGVGRELRGQAIVPTPAREDVDKELDAASERTRPARERARSELDQLEGTRGGGGGGQQGQGAGKRP